MRNMYIGIDPGKTGGIFYLRDEGSWSYEHMPLTNTGDSDVLTLQEHFILLCDVKEVVHYNVHVLVEKQHRNKDAVRQEGRLTALVELLEMRLHSIRPQDWQQEIFSRLEEVPTLENGKTDTKAAAMKFCEDNYIDLPTLNPTGKKLHDGIADAFCMAVYCRFLVEGI